MDKQKKNYHRTKCCNFKKYPLGGYTFIFVSLREEDLGSDFKYYFNADVISVNTDGTFVSGAILTYSPHKTLKDALLRWEDLGPAFVESDNGAGIEELAKMAIEKLPINKWWVN